MTKFKSNFPIKKNIRYKEGDYKIVSFTEYDWKKTESDYIIAYNQQTGISWTPRLVSLGIIYLYQFETNPNPN